MGFSICPHNTTYTIKSIQSGIITGYWNRLVCVSSLYDERLLIVFQLKQPYKLNSNLF